MIDWLIHYKGDVVRLTAMVTGRQGQVPQVFRGKKILNICNLKELIWCTLCEYQSRIKHVENFVRFEICRFVHIHRKGDLF